jgi:putative cardiolipin synthase
VAAKRLLATLLLTACAAPSELPPAPPGKALPPSASGPVADVERAWLEKTGDDRSGFMLLNWNRNSLLWRLALVDSAKTSLDLQYYLWYDDPAGELLFEACMRAADRGVRVRFLIDDLLLVGADRELAAIDSHPHAGIRVFNPWRDRAGGLLGRGIEFLGRFDRLNSRMHNKLTVVDNRMAIVGGRNIGDHYFGLGRRYNFHDLDLLVVGPAARQLSEAFDAYWNAAPVVAAGDLTEGDGEALEELRASVRETIRTAPELDELPRGQADWSEALASLPERLHPGRGRPVYDRPQVDAGGDAVADSASRQTLIEVIAAAEQEVLVENAYWVPSEAAMAYLRTLEERGVRVGFVTNSLASHDVPAVNAGYKRWRRPIVQSGVELYELRHDDFLGLHAKTFVVDREFVYVGSHNFDPRSHEINTELGFLVESRGLAGALVRRIEDDMGGENSWRVGLDEDGRLYWENDETRVERQPARNAWQRIQDAVFGILPIEDQL